MPEAGLRAWIGEVERKLGARTRVMLALAAIAIGAAGAAVYVAVEAQDQAVSEADVRALQQRLEARIGEAGATGGTGALARLESELRALREQVGEPKGKGAGGTSGAGGPSGASGAGGAAGKGAGSGSEAGKGSEGTGGASSGPTRKLGELLERIKKQGSK